MSEKIEKELEEKLANVKGEYGEQQITLYSFDAGDCFHDEMWNYYLKYYQTNLKSCHLLF